MKKKVSKEILCETVFRLYVLRDRSQTCPFLFFLSLPPGEKVPPEGADEGDLRSTARRIVRQTPSKFCFTSKFVKRSTSI